jgi:TPR repeat protein
MKIERMILAVLLLWAWSIKPLMAQPSESDRKAFEVTQAKAEKGDAEAQLLLASLYTDGIGVKRDITKAAKWHRKAAEQGLPRAELEMGLDYATGTGVKSDYTEASRWFQKAADHGLVEAQLKLGLLYAKGDGVKEWPVQAAKCFRKAAEQGLAAAQFELGKCYFEATGVTKDVDEAVAWIRKAADQGYAAAQYRLGLCYMNGEGMTKDLVQAYKWLNLAAAEGEDGGDYSKMDLAKVEHLLTPEQITVGQRLARQFKPTTSGSETNSTGTNATLSSSSNEAKTGFVNVRGDDEACEVFADGAFVGNVPARLKLAEGAHVIEVKKAGFKDYRRELRVTEGSDLTLRATLLKQ